VAHAGRGPTGIGRRRSSPPSRPGRPRPARSPPWPCRPVPASRSERPPEATPLQRPPDGGPWQRTSPRCGFNSVSCASSWRPGGRVARAAAPAAQRQAPTERAFALVVVCSGMRLVASMVSGASSRYRRARTPSPDEAGDEKCRQHGHSARVPGICGWPSGPLEEPLALLGVVPEGTSRVSISPGSESPQGHPPRYLHSLGAGVPAEQLEDGAAQMDRSRRGSTRPYSRRRAHPKVRKTNAERRRAEPRASRHERSHADVDGRDVNGMCARSRGRRERSPGAMSGRRKRRPGALRGAAAALAAVRRDAQALGQRQDQVPGVLKLSRRRPTWMAVPRVWSGPF